MFVEGLHRLSPLFDWKFENDGGSLLVFKARKNVKWGATDKDISIVKRVPGLRPSTVVRFNLQALDGLVGVS